MDDLVVTTSRAVVEKKTEKPRSPSDKGEAGKKWDEFQCILEGMASEEGYRPPQPKPADDRADSASSEKTAPGQTSSRKEVIPSSRHPEGTEEVAQGGEARVETTRPQKETRETPATKEENPSVQMIPEQNRFGWTLGQTNSDGMTEPCADQDMPGKKLTADIDVLATARGTSVPSETAVRDVVERDGGFIQVLVGHEGPILQKGRGRDKGTEVGSNRAKSIDDYPGPGENNPLIVGFDGGGDESGAQGNTKSNDVLSVLSVNASKKYGIVAGDKETAPESIIDDTLDPSSQKTDVQGVQYGAFRGDSPQIRADHAVFKEGSFSSFLRDRIEKIVEHYSSRNTGADMVVRLKLDDQETILVGLKHTTEKLVVEVKASNEGLVNLLQSHKEDIIRHLEDRNIFTRIYIDQDGHNDFDRRRKGFGTHHGRRRGPDGFDSLLDAIA